MSRILLIAMTPLLCFAAYAQDRGGTLKDIVDPAQVAPPALPKVEEAAPRTPDSPADFPLEVRIAQLMFVTLEGASAPSPGDRELMDKLPPGAVVISRVMTPEVAAQYVSGLRGWRKDEPGRIPMMIGVDLLSAGRFRERGRFETIRVPAMLTVAATGATDLTAALYASHASDVAMMGADFHMGPSLALATELDPGVGSLYSFGAIPSLTAALATQLGESLKSKNLAWVPVGFPGGGENRSKRGPSVLLTPRSQLREHDLMPYESAIAAGADMIHVGVALVPTLDSARPACLSNIVIRDVLRDALEFRGIVVAGPMDSQEISAVSNTSDAAVEALMSGADMIYWNTSGPRLVRAVFDIAAAVRKGAIPETLVNDAFARVLQYKAARGIPGWPAPDLKAVKNMAEDLSKREEPLAVERRAITLLRNQGELLPYNVETSGPIGVTGAYGVDELQTALEEYIKRVAGQPIMSAKHLTRIQDFEIRRLTQPNSPIRTVVLICSDDIELKGQLELIRRFHLNSQRVIAVLVGYPKNLLAYQEADAIVIAYGNVLHTEDTMAAVADVIVGNAPVEILPPTGVLQLRAGDEATFDVHDVIRTPVGRLPLSFDAPYVAGYSVSYRPSLAIEDVRWDFGDGRNSRDAVARHRYKKPGDYEITLRIGKAGPFASRGTFRVHVQ